MVHDVIFTSNFFEHLPNTTCLSRTLQHALRCLKPGGKLIAIGPNIKYLHGEYWDFYDHHLYLTETSLGEAMEIEGYQIDVIVPRFLPFTMVSAPEYPMFFVKLYIRFHCLWWIRGLQFLVVAHKPNNSEASMSSIKEPSKALTFYSIVIPAHNEEGALPHTVRELYDAMERAEVPHEIVVVDDGSYDHIWQVLQELKKTIPTLISIRNCPPHGFGRAVVCGLNHMKGDACTIMMADASDAPEHAVRYYQLLNDGWDCVFGSRFIRGGNVVDYPRLKLYVNRLANFFISLLFTIPLNDTTNAFKAYRRTVIDGCTPFLSPHLALLHRSDLHLPANGASALCA